MHTSCFTPCLLLFELATVLAFKSRHDKPLVEELAIEAELPSVIVHLPFSLSSCSRRDPTSGQSINSIDTTPELFKTVFIGWYESAKVALGFTPQFLWLLIFKYQESSKSDIRLHPSKRAR